MVFGVKYEPVYRCLGGLAVVSGGLCGGVFFVGGGKECTKIISMVLAIAAVEFVRGGETCIRALESGEAAMVWGGATGYMYTHMLGRHGVQLPRCAESLLSFVLSSFLSP